MKSSLIRLFIFMILFSLSLCRLNAQENLPMPDSEATISMDFKDAELKDVLKVFSIQSGLNFIASEIVQDRKLTLYLDKVPVKKAMDKIFRANNLSYELDRSDNIFIVKDWGKPKLETITRVYYIKYRGVPSANLDKEKVALLKSAAGAMETDMVGAIKQVLGPIGKVSEDIKTNSLIVTDVPSSFKEVERVISLLDVPQQQLMLEVEILDVSKNIIDKLGFEFGENPFTLILSGDFIKKGAQSYFGPAASRNAEGAVTFGKTYAQVLDFLRTQKDTRYLTRPKLLTLNNETAEISITKDEVVGYDETSSCTTVGTTVERKYIRSTDLKLSPEGTGIFLRVTPQINPETKEIIMVVNPKSSVSTASAIASSQSDVELRTTKSIVKVKSGQTVILGGLIHKDKVVTVKKLPILGDIPLVGGLFRSKNQEKDSERELLIFITPRIVKESAAKIVKARKDIVSQMDEEPVLEISRQEIINEFLNELDRKKK